MFDPISAYIVNRKTKRTWFGGLGTSLAVSGLVALGDNAGVLGAIVIAICWYTFPHIYTVCMGSLLGAIIAPASPDPLVGATVALGLGMILVEPAFVADELRSVVPPTLVGVAILGGTGWAVTRVSDDLWATASIVLMLGGFILYLIHRYERARFYRMEVTT